MSSTFLYSSFSILLLLPTYVQSRDYLMNSDNAFVVSIFSRVAVNVVFGSYSTRFLAAVFPMINVKQPGFRAQKSIASDDAAMPGKERGRVSLVPRSSTTHGASNFGWRADRAFEYFTIRGGCLSCNDR